GKLSTLSLNAFLRTNGQLQFYELSDFGALNLSINRQFFERRLTLTLSFNDMLYTNRNEFRMQQGNIAAFGQRSSDTRRVGFNARYNFGLKKKEEKKGMFDTEDGGS
ncbi:MAG TPA: outer membrane beta-barrel protein, partial [Saprospiraceae bacterium]|nr:outer membrane beta-barrel protein [Saprospiraceae bacterium]